MDTAQATSEAKTWVDFAFSALDFLKYLAPLVIGWLAPSPIFQKMGRKPTGAP